MSNHVLFLSDLLFVYGVSMVLFFVFKHKTAYEVRISDWSSDVCSSDLEAARLRFRSRRSGTLTNIPHQSSAFPVRLDAPSCSHLRKCFDPPVEEGALDEGWTVHREKPFHNGPARAFLAARSSHGPPDRPLPLPALAAAAVAPLRTPQLLRPENTGDVDAARKDMLCSVPDGARCDRRNGIAPGHYVVEGSSRHDGSAHRSCRVEWVVRHLGHRPSDLIAAAVDSGLRH